MDTSTVVSYAKQLKTLLIAHDKAVTQLNLLECKIQRLDQYMFIADVNGSNGYKLRLKTQKSTTLGIRRVYNQYREKKWNQIQEFSTLIMKSASSTQTTENNTLESSTRGRQLDNDSTVQSLTEEFCVLSREC